MTQTIALVDDDRNILASVTMALEAEGFAVKTYTDGAEALRGLASEPPDLAVLDINEDHAPGDRPEILLRDSLAVSFEPSATTTTG